ncbi:MAG: type II toxin-antitoxin system Phd/YefM family antitoxin [Myxococcota bacterium]
MKTIGLFEAKTHLSELCDQVDRTREPILITRRGCPLARIVPAENATQREGIWEAHERFLETQGEPDEDFNAPDRAGDFRSDPLAGE